MAEVDAMSIDRRFEDIEMLEIPDDDESVNSSETERMSDSSDKDVFSTNTEYIDLQDWLKTDEPLKFEFDEEKYKSSIGLDSQFANSYVRYVNGMFKTIETLSTTLPNVQQPTEKFGLITEDVDKKNEHERNLKINDSLDKIILELDEFLKQLESSDDENITRFQNLYSILECLQASSFAKLTNKPELLAQWVNRFDHIPDDETATEIMIHTPKPYLHPKFWNGLVVQLVTRGLFTQAAESISKSKFEELSETAPDLHELISDFKLLLSEYPNYALKNQFQSWKLSACETRDSISQYRRLITSPEHQRILNQVHDLLCIVTGLPKTIANYSESWYDIYIALSLFKIRDDDTVYREYYDLAISEKPLGPPADDDVYDVTERCFTDIIQENFLKVIKTIHDLDQATAAYISKLLELKGYLQIYYSGTEKRSINNLVQKRTFSEYFLTRHAFEALNFHQLVPAGIGLLLNENISPDLIRNLKIVADFLPKYTFHTNDDLEWALTICAKFDLTSTSRQLNYIHGLKSLDGGHIFEALGMLVNSIDDSDANSDGLKKIQYVTWELLFQDALINNRPIKDELINNIVANKTDESLDIHPIIMHCISPYAVLHEFFDSLAAKNFKLPNALSKLHYLLRFNYLPKKFYPVLLGQYLPLLIDSTLRFELSDLMLIIDLINNYEDTVTKEQTEEGEELYKYTIENFEDEVSDYDWRIILKNKNKVPETVEALINSIRTEVISITAKVFIDA